MKCFIRTKNLNSASEIVKAKLNGGKAVIPTMGGKPFEISVSEDGKFINGEKLPNNTYDFTVFDRMAEVLSKNGGKAKKGSSKGLKLGDEKCDESTVVGYIGKNYFGKKIGESVPDHVSALSAIMDWAGIAMNKRGELELTFSFKNR